MTSVIDQLELWPLWTVLAFVINDDVRSFGCQFLSDQIEEEFEVWSRTSCKSIVWSHKSHAKFRSVITFITIKALFLILRLLARILPVRWRLFVYSHSLLRCWNKIKVGPKWSPTGGSTVSERCVCVRVWVNVCVWVVFCMCVHFSLSLSLSLDSKIPVTTPLMVGIFSDRRHEEESRPRSIAAVIRALFSLRLNMRTRTTPFAPAVSKREIGQWLA